MAGTCFACLCCFHLTLPRTLCFWKHFNSICWVPPFIPVLFSVQGGPKEWYMMITRLLSHFFQQKANLYVQTSAGVNLDAAHLYVPYDSGHHGSLNICGGWCAERIRCVGGGCCEELLYPHQAGDMFLPETTLPVTMTTNRNFPSTKCFSTQIQPSPPLPQHPPPWLLPARRLRASSGVWGMLSNWSPADEQSEPGHMTNWDVSAIVASLLPL